MCTSICRTRETITKSVQGHAKDPRKGTHSQNVGLMMSAHGESGHTNDQRREGVEAACPTRRLGNVRQSSTVQTKDRVGEEALGNGQLEEETQSTTEPEHDGDGDVLWKGFENGFQPIIDLLNRRRRYGPALGES